ncbi:MAG: hypothetical protein DRQ51_00175 [Gammaproteobacteria bacterium]|nr:MAG: hypothetical protein DRQ51_00175 [Gammaproteobacteria bacterium]
MLWNYKAVNDNGDTINGVINCTNKEQLLTLLDKKNLSLLSCHKKRKYFNFFAKKTLNTDELIAFCQQLQFLLQAGVSLGESLHIISLNASKKNNNQAMLHIFYKDVSGGLKLSQSMQKFTSTFDGVFINMIRVGEDSVKLDLILKNLVNYLQQKEQNIKKIKKILTIPILSFTVIIAVASFLLWYLVPQLTGFIRSFDASLPFYTKALLSLASFLKNYGIFLLITFLTTLMIIKIMLKTSQKFHLIWDRLIIKLPLIGDILYQTKLSRFFYCLSTLHQSGHSFADSLDISINGLDNLYLQKYMKIAYQKIIQGEQIADAMKKILNIEAYAMIKIGQQSGKINLSIDSIQQLYDKQTTDKIDKIEPLITPVLTIILGLLVGWIIMSILLPIYDVILLID